MGVCRARLLGPACAAHACVPDATVFKAVPANIGPATPNSHCLTVGIRQYCRWIEAAVILSAAPNVISC